MARHEAEHNKEETLAKAHAKECTRVVLEARSLKERLQESTLEWFITPG